MTKATSVIYNPPKSYFKELKGFRLKNLEKVFDVAHYERRMSGRHVNRIVQAILQSKFYDNTIRVIKSTKTKKYLIVDGQHRIEAFRILRDQYGLMSYDITLQVFEEKDQRDVYRRLNLGKKLTLKDHLKAIDNGSIRLFNRLRQYYHHDVSKDNPRFEHIVNAVYYSKTLTMKAIEIQDIEKFLKGVTDKELHTVREFTIGIKNLGVKPNSKFFKANFYRNLYRVFVEKKIGRKELEQFAILASNDKYILERNDSRNTQAVLELYEHLISTVYPKLSGKIEKIEKKLGKQIASPIFVKS